MTWLNLLTVEEKNSECITVKGSLLKKKKK